MCDLALILLVVIFCSFFDVSEEFPRKFGMALDLTMWTYPTFLNKGIIVSSTPHGNKASEGQIQVFNFKIW